MGKKICDLISIVLVTYNSEETVRETLDSFTTQDYPRIEVIVSDDASDDATMDIVRAWIKEGQNEKRFERVLINKNEKNIGVTANCNKAIELTSGTYIQLIAGDDILLSNCCSEKIRFSKEFDQKIVYSQVEVFSEKKDIILASEMKKMAERGYEIMRSYADVQLEEIVKGNYIPGPCGGFFEKDFIINVMGGFDERFRNIEDWPFHLKYLSNNYRIRLLEKPLVRYRVRGNSLCHGNGNEYEDDVFNFFIKERLGFLLKYKQYDLISMQWRDFQDKKGREDNAAYRKFRLYYDELYQWMNLKQADINLSSYFKENDINSIAIYGLGDMGRLLKKELAETDVQLKYAIDRVSAGVKDDIDILGIEDDFPEVDAIIVTPTFAFDEVKGMLERKVDCPIISLHEVINVVYCKYSF